MRRSAPASVCNMAKFKRGYGKPKTPAQKLALAIKAGKHVYKGVKIINKYRQRPSRTKTKTKQKNKIPTSKPRVEGGFHQSYAQYGRLKKSPKAVHSTTPPYFYSYQNTQRLTNTVGKQSYDGVTASMWTPNDIYILQGAAAQTNNTYLKSYKHIATGTNATNVGQYLMIYNLVAKRDIKYDGSSDPGNVWLEGDADITATTGPTYYNSTPFTTKRFNEYFRCWKATEYKLGAGETFKHTTVINANRMFSGSLITELTSGTGTPIVRQGGFKGLTQYLLFVQRPCPAHDSTTKTAATVTIPIANIDIVFSVQMCGFDVMESKATQKFQSQTLNTSFAVGPQQEAEDLDALVSIVS